MIVKNSNTSKKEQCSTHNQFTTLSWRKWIGRKVCGHQWELIPEGIGCQGKCLWINAYLHGHTTQQQPTITYGTTEQMTYTDLQISNLIWSMICGHSYDYINLQNQRKSDPKTQVECPVPPPKDTPIMVGDTIHNKWFLVTIRSPQSEPNSCYVVSNNGIAYRYQDFFNCLKLTRMKQR